MNLSKKQNEFKELIKTATPDELIWMSGFLHGLLSKNEQNIESSLLNKSLAISSCSVLYGTETGNSKKLANDFATKLKKEGVQVKLKSMDQYRLVDLEKEVHLLLILSTQGDGEPPEAAKKFYNHIHEQNLSLNQLRYGVVALGDRAYPLFCKAGEDVDKRLAQLNAQRMTELQKCDVDYEQTAHDWFDQLIKSRFVKNESTVTFLSNPQKKIPGSGKRTYDGSVLTTVNLNDEGSNKETYHIEIQTSEPFYYEPGDSVAIVPLNSVQTIGPILNLLGLDGSEELVYKESTDTIFNLLEKKINIQNLPERVVKQYAELIKEEIPIKRVDLLYLLNTYPHKHDFKTLIQQIISILDPIVPRMYSISSSPATHGDSEIHITVSKHNFVKDDKKLYGLCSDYLSHLKVGEQLQISLHKNNSFRLPSSEADVIMIGPGTGIAPFRSFLFEREAASASGRNWLFFGEQHFVTDFLYQTELQEFYNTGTLTRLNTAFSRDQKGKIYVQDKIEQNAEELLNWLDNGAHIYICGAKEPMSLDVEKTLMKIFSKKKNMSMEEAQTELELLCEEGRYHKDVY